MSKLFRKVAPIFGEIGYPSSVGAYYNKLLGVEPSSLIGYWKMDEASGSTIVDTSPQGNDGTYVGVTLEDTDGPVPGDKAPLWTDTADSGDVYSAGFAADFGKTKGTLVIWAKVKEVGVWTDGADRFLFHLGKDISTSEVAIAINAGNDGIVFTYVAASTIDSFTVTGQSGIGWEHWACTWDLTAGASSGEFKGFKDGIQIGSTQISLGTWVDDLASNVCTIGAQRTDGLREYSGWLAHAAAWNTPLTAAQILSLATV